MFIQIECTAYVYDIYDIYDIDIHNMYVRPRAIVRVCVKIGVRARARARRNNGKYGA